MNAYKELLSRKTEFKGYADLCRFLGEPIYKSQSHSQKSQFDEWARYFEREEFTNEGKRRKGIRVTNVYDFPLPKKIKRSIYAEDIRALILYWLSQSEDCRIVFSNKSKLETLGFVNKDYNRIQNLTLVAQSKYLSRNNINHATYIDFLTKNNNNFRDRLDVVYNNLIESGLIYTPNSIYAIKEREYGEHIYLSETDIRHEIITGITQLVLQKHFNVTDFKAIRLSKTKLKKFNKIAVELINIAFNKIDKSEIDFFYKVTEIKGINKEHIQSVCMIDDVKTTLISLNTKIAENIINSAIKENAVEINKRHSKKLAEIEQLKEEDYDAYYDLCEQVYWETKDEYGTFRSPESEWLRSGNRGSNTYIDEMILLTKLLILKSEEEIEVNCRVLKGVN